VFSARGANGGYTLARDPKTISLKEVVDVLEGETCLVDCVRDPSTCQRTSLCSIRDVWMNIGDKIAGAMSEVTLAQMADESINKKNKNVNYEI
jgi:Rrf2 family protein